MVRFLTISNRHGYFNRFTEDRKTAKKELFGKAINICYNDDSHHPAHNSSPVYISHV